MLHGPAAPRSHNYGQPVRQNRERRAWLATLRLGASDDLHELVETIMWMLNRVYRRSTMDWKTAAEAWQQRLGIDVDRAVSHEK